MPSVRRAGCLHSAFWSVRLGFVVGMGVGTAQPLGLDAEGAGLHSWWGVLWFESVVVEIALFRRWGACWIRRVHTGAAARKL